MMKIRDIKAYARETMLGHYATVIGAGILSSLLQFLCCLAAVLMFCAALFNTDSFSGTAQEIFPGFVPRPEVMIIASILFSALMVFLVILSLWLSYGRKKLILNICRGQKSGCSDIFYAFRRGSHPWRIVGADILRNIFSDAVFLVPALVQLLMDFGGFRSSADPAAFRTTTLVIAGLYTVAFLVSVFLMLGFTFADTVLLDRPGTGVLEALKESMRLLRWKKLKLLWFCITFLFWLFLISIVPIAALWVVPYMDAAITIFYLSLRGEDQVIPARKEEIRSAVGYTDIPEDNSNTAPVSAETAENIKPAVFFENQTEPLSAAPAAAAPVPEPADRIPESLASAEENSVQETVINCPPEPVPEKPVCEAPAGETSAAEAPAGESPAQDASADVPAADELLSSADVIIEEDESFTGKEEGSYL